MKVLFVCHRVPFPPKRGGKIRPFNIIRHLHEQGHQVTVASLARTAEERREARGTVGSTASAASSKSIPNRAGLAAHGRVAADDAAVELRLLPLRRAAAAHRAGAAHAGHTTWCSSTARRSRRTCRRPAAARRSSTSATWTRRSGANTRSFALFRSRPAIGSRRSSSSAAERLLSEQFDLCTCTTRAELESLRQLGVKTRTDWFPNGVDAEFFAPTEAPLRQRPDRRSSVEWTIFRTSRPSSASAGTCCRCSTRAGRTLQFQIVGADPSREIRELGKTTGCVGHGVGAGRAART